MFCLFLMVPWWVSPEALCYDLSKTLYPNGGSQRRHCVMTLSEILYPKSLLTFRAACFALIIESML